MGKVSRQKQVQALAASGHCRIYHLRNINDGCLLEVMDEGPLETNPNFRVLDPTGTRQQLVKMLRKVDGDTNLPIFWSDRPGQPDVFDHASKQYIKIPVIDQHALAVMKANLARRNSTADASRRMLGRAKQDAEEVLGAAAAAAVGAPNKTAADVIAENNAAGLPPPQ